MDFDIVVIGSINNDLTVVTPRLPHAGETVLGTSHYSDQGGKGANQAVAATRLGATVAMLGRVGDDPAGNAALTALAAAGVDVSAVGVDAHLGTGVAVITVDAAAENTIVVSPGANMGLLPEHLDDVLISRARVVLTQLEVPVETLAVAARVCTGTLILNPAPARPLPAQLLSRVDVLVPNRSELGELGGSAEPTTVEEAAAIAGRLSHRGATVVTLGAEGALIVDGETVTEVPAPQVQPVDPTGAGDAFCAALAHGLSRGSDLADAVRRAVAAGALATTRQGAQAAMPTGPEVEALLGA